MQVQIGFIDTVRETGKCIASCGCGVVGLLGKRNYYWNANHTCEKCGNTNFADIRNKSNNRVIYPYLEVLDKNRRGFKVKRTNISVFRDKEYNVYYKENMVKVLLYDLANKKIKIYKDGKPTGDISLNTYYSIDKNVVNFFTGIDNGKFMNLISTEENKEIYKFAMDELSLKGNDSYYSSNKKIYTGLINLFHNPHVEILVNAGFTDISRFTRRGNSEYFNKKGKSPKEILGIPKFAVNFVKNDSNFGTYEIRQLRDASKKIDGNKLRELMDIAQDESSISVLLRTLDRLLELHNDYGYNNLRKLFLYAVREVRMNQGITQPDTAVTLLRDYVRMANTMEIEYEKYPKSLKKEHDITAMNYNSMKSEYEKKQFKQIVESDTYKDLEFKNKEYVIISPQGQEDLSKEGNVLNHCIASYTKDIINKKCKIYFLRKKEDVESPLISIEIRNSNVRQVRGRSNRRATEEERAVISEWAKKKNLEENYY